MGLPACPSSNCPPHWEEPLLRSPGVYIFSHDLDVASVPVPHTLHILPCNWGFIHLPHLWSKAGEVRRGRNHSYTTVGGGDLRWSRTISNPLQETEPAFAIRSVNCVLVFLYLELSNSFSQNTGFLDHRYYIFQRRFTKQQRVRSGKMWAWQTQPPRVEPRM